jgi:hypothetical protein
MKTSTPIRIFRGLLFVSLVALFPVYAGTDAWNEEAWWITNPTTGGGKKPAGVVRLHINFAISASVAQQLRSAMSSDDRGTVVKHLRGLARRAPLEDQPAVESVAAAYAQRAVSPWVVRVYSDVRRSPQATESSFIELCFETPVSDADYEAFVQFRVKPQDSALQAIVARIFGGDASALQILNRGAKVGSERVAVR